MVLICSWLIYNLLRTVAFSLAFVVSVYPETLSQDGVWVCSRLVHAARSSPWLGPAVCSHQAVFIICRGFRAAWGR